jgi:hypothetical protein
MEVQCGGPDELEDNSEAFLPLVITTHKLYRGIYVISVAHSLTGMSNFVSVTYGARFNRH